MNRNPKPIFITRQSTKMINDCMLFKDIYLKRRAGNWKWKTNFHKGFMEGIWFWK